MMNFKKIALSLLVTASSLLAIDAVTNLSVSAPHNSGTVTNDASMDFTWTPPADVAKYYYKLDTNSTNYDFVDAGGYSTLNSTGSTLTVTAAASGSYYLHIAAVDSSGSTSVPKLVQVTSSIDIDSGAVTMSPVGGSITTDTNSITLTGTEAGTIYFTVDGTTPTTASTVYTTPLVIGVSATVKALLVDSAGNEGAVASEAYSITNNPTLLRAEDNVEMSNGDTISTSTTSLLKVSGTDFTRYKYRNSATSWTATEYSIGTAIDISSLAAGTYTYEIVGGDAYNFQATSTPTAITFVVSNTAPSGLTISVNSVEADETNSTTVTFGDNFFFTLSTDDTTDTIHYTTDGSTPDNTDSTYGTTAIETNLLVSDGSVGEVTIKMIAYDTLDNASDVKSVKFYIDKKAPTVTMPVSEAFAVDYSVAFSSDDNLSTLYYKLLENNATQTTSVDMTGWTVSNDSTAVITSGSTKYLYVTAKDQVNNISDVQVAKYTYQADNFVNLASVLPYSFGSTETNASVSGVITITNSGTEIITLSESNMSIVGDDFNITSTTCATLASAKKCTIALSFTPSVKGDLNATLSVAYNGTNSNKLSIELSGTRVNAVPVISSIPSQRATQDSNATNIVIDVNATDGDADTITYDANSSDTSIATVDMNATTSQLTIDITGVAGTAVITVLVQTADANVTEEFTVTVKDTNVVFIADNTSTYNEDTNETVTTFEPQNGLTLEVTERNGLVSADFGGNSLNIQAVGSDIEVDENGTISTSLQNVGSTTMIMVSAEGISTNSVVIGQNTTEVESSIDTNSTVDSNGNVTAQFTIQNSVVELVVSADDGVLTPTLPSTVVIPATLPVGTKATVDSSSIKFEFKLPATLTFN